MPERSLVVGDALHMPEPIPALLVGPLRELVRDLQYRDGAMHPLLLAFVGSVEQLARVQRARSAIGTIGTPDVPIPAPHETLLPKMTTAEAATVLGISERAVTARCRRGTLPARLVGGRWLIEATKIERATR